MLNSKDCHERLGIRPRGAWLVRVAAVMLASLMPGLAGALTAGQIGVLSHLNEPFRATVPLSALQVGEVGELKVRLADESAYRALGLDKTLFLHSLQFEVREGDTSDQASLLITTTETAKEPFFSMLLAFQGMSGTLIREYTVLLDPNTGRSRDDSAPVVAVQPVAPTSAQATPAEPVTAEPVAAQPQAPSQTREAASELPQTQPVVRQGSAPVVAAQPFRSGAAERKVPVPTPSVQQGEAAAPADAPAQGPVAYENQPVSYASEFGPVNAGMTLWQIAAAVRPNPSVTMNQVMWGLYSNNPAQFDGNLNLVKRGAILSVPSLQALRDVSPAEANALVADEAQRHRDLLAGTRSAPSQAVAVERVRPAPVAAPVEKPSVLPAAEKPARAEPAREIREPAEQSLQVVEEEPVFVPSESVLPAAQDAQSDEMVADADDYEQLEALPADDVQQESDYTELPSLPVGEADSQASEDEMVGDELGEASYDEPAQDNAGEQYPNLLGVGLAALGVLVLGLLVVLGLRRRGQDKDDGPVSDFASPAPPVRKPVSDFAAPAAASQIDELDDTVDIDATATGDLDDSLTQELEPTAGQDVGHETQDFEIPDLDDFVAGGQAVDSTDEFDQTAKFDQPQTPEVDFGDTEVQQPAADPAESDLSVDEMDFSELESATQTLDLGSETVSLELNEDPLSEADFQLAYGLYDEAALLLNRAIENEPDRLDLHEKLVETHFAASDASQFKQAAETLKARNPDGETWQRIAIMGQQLCPGDELFSDVGDDAGGALDVDMAFDAPAADSATSMDSASATTDDNALEFTLDDVDAPESEAGQPAAAQGADDNLLEFNLDDATKAAAASPDVLASVDDDYEADFGEFGDDSQSSVELSELDDLNLDDLEAELDADNLIDSAPEAAPEAEPAPASSANEAMEDFADLTISDVSNTELLVGTETDDASDVDVIGSETEFELEEPQSTSEPSGFDTEFDLGDDATGHSDGQSDDFSLSDIDLGDDAQTQALDDDLTLSVDEPDLSTSDDDLTLEDIQAATSDDALDLGDLDLTEGDTGQVTDFSLDELSLDETAMDSDDLSDLTLDDDNDLSADLSGVETDFNLDDLGGDAQEVAGGDESATKLDLARAYVDMGESDMAKNLLDEVVTAGSDEQKAIAQELLSKL